MKMSTNTLILFLFIIMHVRALEIQPILLKISSETNYCNKVQLLKNFELSKVSQFDAMCNIPQPNNSMAQYLVKNNVVPILCMGLYDASDRLCKAAANDISPFKVLFPPTVEKYKNIFTTLNRSEDYSNLSKFCTNTTKNYAIQKSASNITEFWWQVFNQQLNDINSCLWMCRTYDNHVKPLCSYIIWANAIYLNHTKSLVESQATTMVEEPINIVLQSKLDKLKNKVEKHPEGLSPIENLPSLVENDVSGAQAATPPLLEPAEPSLVIVDPNVTLGPLEVTLGQSEQLNTGQNIIHENISEQPVNLIPNKSLDTSNNNTEREPSVKFSNFEVKPLNKSDNGKKNHLKNKPAVEKVTTNPVEVSQGSAIEASKIDSNKNPVVAKPQPVDQVNPKSEKTVHPMVEGDFSFEVTPEGVGLDQPIAADKDLQQPPYSDEEAEDEDGDDIEMGPEGPVKIANNIVTSKFDPKKQNTQVRYQGGAEPDKAYGDDEREILIEDHFIEAEDSHFILYFLWMTVLTVLVYVAFHNKKKLLALAMEGRRSRNSRRRPNCSNYSKLDCSLEEAMVSNTTASVTHVLY